jgi:hypothetical protein
MLKRRDRIWMPPGERLIASVRGLSTGFLGGGLVRPLAGLVYDWDADNAVNSGGVVTGNMTDSIGGISLAPTASPVWASNVINGHASITLNGTTQYMSVGAGVTIAQPLEMWSVHKTITWTSSGTIIGGACTTCFNGSSPQLGVYAGGGARQVTDGDLAVGTWGICRAVFNGVSSTVTIGTGSTNTTGTSPGTAGLTGGFVWGGWSGGINLSNVSITRTMIYNPGAGGFSAAAILASLRSEPC